MPRGWIEGEVQWEALLARRWRAHMSIGEGESRSIAMWARVLARCPLGRRSEFLDRSDNFGAVALACRGRAAAPHLNRVCQVIAAAECVGDFRMLATWADTARMPADDGTGKKNPGAETCVSFWIFLGLRTFNCLC